MTDLIATHVAALDKVLRGPRRTRRCMVAEARAGLHDAAEAYRAKGVAPERAAALAVREFGTVREVAPSYQSELVARQGRWAALLFVLVFPGMLIGWDLLWSSGVVRRERSQVSDLVLMLAKLQDMTTILVGIVALALLAVTFHRAVSPRGLTIVIGVIGMVGALSCGGISVAMNIAGGRSTVAMVATNPATIPAFAGSGLVMLLIIWQAVRTLQVAGAAGPDWSHGASSP